MKQVSLAWQVMATIFVPTGLYAFRRINKGKFGIVIYVISIGMPFLFGLFAPSQTLETCNYFNNIEYCKPSENIFTYTIIILILGILSFLMPILFIAKWSREWNEKWNSGIAKNSYSSEQKYKTG